MKPCLKCGAKGHAAQDHAWDRELRARDRRRRDDLADDWIDKLLADGPPVDRRDWWMR